MQTPTPAYLLDLHLTEICVILDKSLGTTGQ